MSCDIEYLKKQLLFLEQNRNFPKRLCVRSKNVFLSSGVLVALVVTKKSVLRTSSDLSTWNNTCFLFKCRVTFGCASFRRLGLVFWLFTSCVWDVLQYRILRKKQLLIFSKTWSSSFCIVCNCFDDFRTNLPKKFGRFRRKKTPTFQNDVEYVPKKSVWALICYFFGCNSKTCFETLLRSLFVEQYVVFVQMQSHVAAAPVFEG